MLENNFFPIDVEPLLKGMALDKHQVGHQIIIYEDIFPNLEPIKVVIIGLNETSNYIRKHLYQMSFNFNKLKIADLGIIKEEEPLYISTVLNQLLIQGIVPVVIGSSKSLQSSLFKAYDSFNQLINLVWIDEKIQLTTDRRKKKISALDTIVYHKNLFNLGILGYQSHYVHQKTLSFLEHHHFEYVRLGQVKKYIDETEPIIRDADCLIFNLNALKRAEAPAHINSSPSGLLSEEACQLSYYAGMNDKLTALGIWGFEAKLDIQEQSAHLIAQVIWYFLSGFTERQQDYPISMGSFTEYIVDFKNNDYQITFWKSTRSDRWWMQVPTYNSKQERHRLIPCSYQDYLLACKEEFPERLLNALNRFS